MISKKTGKIVVISVIAIAATAAVALAHGGRWSDGPMRGYGPGYDRGYRMGMGPGVHGYADGYGPGYRDGYSPRGRGYRSDTALSKEQIEKLEAAREKFYDETKALRNKIRDKRIALNDAMDTDKPDGKKVAELQKELSQLRSEFDEKAVQHQLEVQALVPDDARGRGFGRSGRSFGTGYGGYCWR